MSTKKRCIANFSFYDGAAIEKKLEKMASEGWMVIKAGNLFWTYEKTEPQKLRFAVTYFPGASEFDPEPSDEQLNKEEFCSHDGWKLILRWDAMQIFCTDREDAVPIETDPVPHVENIHRTMKKKLLTGQLLSFAMMVWYLYLQISNLLRDPVHFLSSTYRVFMIPIWIILLFGEVYHLCTYLHWQKKAKEAAKNGYFLPVHSNKWLRWGIVIVTVLCLIIAYAGDNFQLLFMICFASVMAVVYIIGRLLMKRMKESGVPRTLNLVVSSVCGVILAMIGVSLIVAAGIKGWLPIDDSKPVDTYEWDGRIYDIYDDSLPLNVEDITEVDARWSKKADYQESMLLSYGDYRQDILYTEKAGHYDLHYEIIDVKLPLLYDFIKNSCLDARQDEIHDDYVFINHFEAVDPEIWSAKEAYQLHWSDSVLDTYLLCYENRIAQIKFFWEPTAEQIQAAAQILGNK